MDDLATGNQSCHKHTIDLANIAPHGDTVHYFSPKCKHCHKMTLNVIMVGQTYELPLLLDILYTKSSAYHHNILMIAVEK